MNRPPPHSTLSDTHFPYTMHFRSPVRSTQQFIEARPDPQWRYWVRRCGTVDELADGEAPAADIDVITAIGGRGDHAAELVVVEFETLDLGTPQLGQG